MSYLQMYSTGVYCVVQVGYGLGVKTVLVSGCFGAQCSVAPARGQQFKEKVSWVWDVQSDRLSPFPHSGGVKFLEAGQSMYECMFVHVYVVYEDIHLYNDMGMT